LAKIKLPPNFHIAVFAQVPGARSMALGPEGVVFVGTRHEGKVYAVHYRAGRPAADKVATAASGLDMPNGVAYRGGSLYVAEVSRLIRYDGVDEHPDQLSPPHVVFGGFPQSRAHGWKFIAFGPDGKLYVPVGAPCNSCDAGAPYASITRLDASGAPWEVFAEGVRNTVGFDWQPETGDLWFTDNGRDNMGDDLPPDELNRAAAPGLHFGFPYMHGKGVPDDEFGKKGGRRNFTPPALELGPHVAALGVRFYRGGMFPAEYKDRVFIAEHGSWNRSRPLGYRITTARVAGDAASGYDVFAEGWLAGRAAWGRPVDVLFLPDGSLLVSDDEAGVLYRITYKMP
jgi:glucose/arabinose dehydrogenase